MKKIIFAVLATAAMDSTVAIPHVANAHESKSHDRSQSSCRGRGTSYAVYYQRDRFDDWHYYGCYDSRFRADINALRLKAKGFRVSVEQG